jgi:hypothetical protein
MNDDGEQLRAFHQSVQDVHNRFNGCLSCQNPRGDVVRACIANVLVNLWDGRTPTPPTPEQLKRSCCRYAGASAYTIALQPMLREGPRR